MAASPKANRPKSRIVVKPGDYVALACSTASTPKHWYIGRVLWADEHDVLVHRSSMTGSDFYREVASVQAVRAAGTIDQVADARRRAVEAVRELEREVTACEAAMSRARTAVWAQIDRLAEEGVPVIPRDAEAIDQAQRADRKAVEAIDAEERA